MFNKPKMTPEEYTKLLQQALPSGLRSVILYGSAALAEPGAKVSDYNLLVIGDAWGVLELNQVAKITKAWMQQGNPPPLLFTRERLQASADCFPIEMLDMKQAYRLLCGEDVLAGVQVHATHLRLMVERELKSLKIQLRENYIYAERDEARIAKLLASTLSTSLVLFRAALRLHSKAVPMKNFDVLPVIKELVAVDVDAFAAIRSIKEGTLRPEKANVQNLFERYLASIIAVADLVDGHGRKA
jgi:hypothetical protein